jgi:hypothetical protein
MSPTEGFLRHGSDTYIANFAETEREVLVNLVQQIIEILAERHDHANEDPLAAMVGITTPKALCAIRNVLMPCRFACSY